MYETRAFDLDSEKHSMSVQSVINQHKRYCSTVFVFMFRVFFNLTMHAYILNKIRDSFDPSTIIFICEQKI